MENATNVLLPAGAKAEAISAGGETTCAVLVTGKVRCWGFGFSWNDGDDNTDNVGDNTNTDAMANGSDLPLPANAVAVSAGANSACALLVTGKVRCWGAGLFGELGSDATSNIGDTANSMENASDVVLPSIVGANTNVADLSLTVVPTATKVVERGTDTVTITVHNAGPSTASGVTVSAPLPSGTTLRSDTATHGVWNQSTSSWPIGPSIPAGGSETLTLNINMPGGFTQPSATYQITAAGQFDPNSIPGDNRVGEDDIDVLTLETTPAAEDETPPSQQPAFAYDSQWGSAGSGDGQFNQPWGVALDNSVSPAFVDVTDFGNNRVETFLQGGYVTQFGTAGGGLGQFEGPEGIAVHNQKAYVVDTGGYLSPRVQVYGLTTNPPTYDFTFAENGSVNYPGSTNAPAGIGIDPFNGHPDVTDTPFKPVQEYDAAGNFIREFGSGFSGAADIAITRTGKMFVVDPGNDQVQIYDSTGTKVGAFGSSGSGNGQFSNPTGIALDQSQHVVFVTDTGNNRVEVFDYQGNYLQQFGGTGSGNGELNAPHGIAVLESTTYTHYIYVADTGNNRIEVFKATYFPPPPPPKKPGNCTGNTALTTLDMGVAQVSGCMTHQAEGTYTAPGTVSLNGVPLVPPNGSDFEIDPSKQTLGVQNNGNGEITLNGVVVYKGPLGFAFPSEPSKGAGSMTYDGFEAAGDFYGLLLKATFDLTLGGDDSGHYYTSFGLTVGLPTVLEKAGGGNVTAAVSVTVDEDGTVNFGGVNFSLKDLKLGPLDVGDACFALVPDGGNIDDCPQPTIEQEPTLTNFSPLTSDEPDGFLECVPDDTPGAHCSAEFAIKLPTEDGPVVAAYGSGNGPTLASLGGFGSDLDIPIADGVTLNSLGAGVCLPTASSPELAIKGLVGIGLIPLDEGSLIDIEGSVTYRGNSNDWSDWSLGFDGDVSIKDFGKIGTGGLDIDSDGTFGANVGVTFRLLGFIFVTGQVSGWYSPPTKAYDVEGGIQACPFDQQEVCIGINALVSNKGFAACATATSWFGAGFGYTWGASGVTPLDNTCDFGPWRPHKSASTAASGRFTITLPAGEKAIGFRAFGAKAPPGLRVTGPGGTSIVVPAGSPFRSSAKLFVMQDPTNNTTNVALGDLKPGKYTIVSLDPSNPITRVDTSQAYAPFKGHGTVRSSRHGTKRLSLTYVQPTGSSVALVERSNNRGAATVQQTIAANLHGHRCPGAQSPISGGSRLCATVSFTPAHGRGGIRKIVAVVSRNRMPYANVTVAHYRAPAPQRPGAAKSIQLRRTHTTVTVRWSRAAGVSQYGVTADISGQQSVSRFLPVTCTGLKLLKVTKKASVTVKLVGLRYDGLAGHRVTARLKPGKATGGSRGHALAGKLCR